MPLDEKLVQSTADGIIKDGTTFDYIFDVWQRRHAIDSLIGKSLLISVGPQSISNSKGIHVQICGKGGIGKSDAAAQMCNLIDPHYMLDAAVTPQALFYPTEHFVDSSIVFIDDMVWKSDLGTSVKRITSQFQKGAQRLVTTENMAKRQASKQRLTFWASCVDSQADEQIRDRFLLVESDGSKQQLHDKIQSIKQRDAGETNADPDDLVFQTAVCHALIRDLKKQFFEVLIPFATNIEFQGDIRAYVMFSDMIKSFAVFSYATRQQDVFCRLIATINDFNKAKQLYEELGGHSADKYTKIEQHFLEALHANGNHATQAEMQKFLNLSSGRIGDILHGRGRDDQQKHGLLYKCPYLEMDRSQKPYVIRLADDWSPETQTGSLVTLRPKSTAETIAVALT
jgi:hypothetical protein